MFTLPPTRKRAASKPSEIASTQPTKRMKTPLTGPAFVQGIADIHDATSTPVSTQFEMPRKYGKAGNPKDYPLSFDARFYARNQNVKDDEAHEWTQGMMDMGGETSYSKVIPEDLSLKRATFETRTMKKLAVGAGYTPPAADFTGEVTAKPKLDEATKNWGRPAVQSYLEDITARTALGISEVGSGMRADLLAAKLKMQNKKTDEITGFNGKMTDRFPQLLTEGTGGGAAVLGRTIQTEMEASGDGVSSATRDELTQNVIDAHLAVNKQIGKRFEKKWAGLEAGTMTTGQAGKWWQGKLPTVTDAATFATATGTMDKAALQQEYLATKLNKHDITLFE